MSHVQGHYPEDWWITGQPRRPGSENFCQYLSFCPSLPPPPPRPCPLLFFLLSYLPPPPSVLYFSSVKRPKHPFLTHLRVLHSVLNRDTLQGRHWLDGIMSASSMSFCTIFYHISKTRSTSFDITPLKEGKAGQGEADEGRKEEET